MNDPPPEVEAEAETEAEAEVETEFETEVEAEVEAEVETDVEADIEADVEAGVEAEIKANAKAKAYPLDNFLRTHRALVSTISSFLTVSIHQILYLRRIYPPVSFLSARAYNYPVRQSRHPAVCTWVLHAISAVKDQLEKNAVEQVSVCIFECTQNRVLERWKFDLRGFPVMEKREHHASLDGTSDEDADEEDEDGHEEEDQDEDEDEDGNGDENEDENGDEDGDEDEDEEDMVLRKKINVADLEAQFRAMLARITSSVGRLKALPEGPGAPEISFTVTIEVKEDADRPVGRHEKDGNAWVAAEPDVFKDPKSEAAAGPENEDASKIGLPEEPQRGKTVPVRRLEAGELMMEVWVEESTAKLDYENISSGRQRNAPVPQEPGASVNPNPDQVPGPTDSIERRQKVRFAASTVGEIPS